MKAYLSEKALKKLNEPSKLNAKHQCVNPWFTFRNNP